MYEFSAKNVKSIQKLENVSAINQRDTSDSISVKVSMKYGHRYICRSLYRKVSEKDLRLMAIFRGGGAGRGEGGTIEFERQQGKKNSNYNRTRLTVQDNKVASIQPVCPSQLTVCSFNIQKSFDPLSKFPKFILCETLFPL